MVRSRRTTPRAWRNRRGNAKESCTMETLTLEKQMTAEPPAPAVELPVSPVPAPTPHPFRRVFGKSPIGLWRLGFGPLIGQTFMIMTTTGRRSGLPRQTVIQYFTYEGRRYIYSGHGAE